MRQLSIQLVKSSFMKVNHYKSKHWLTPNSKLNRAPKITMLNHPNGKTNGLVYIKHKKRETLMNHIHVIVDVFHSVLVCNLDFFFFFIFIDLWLLNISILLMPLFGVVINYAFYICRTRRCDWDAEMQWSRWSTMVHAEVRWSFVEGWWFSKIM